MESFSELVPDLPSGPLDEYRKTASFCWKEMKIFYEGGSELFEFKYKIFKVLEKDPLFRRSPAAWLSIAEQRELAVKQTNALFEYDFLNEDETMGNPSKIQKISELLAQFDISMNGRIGLSSQVFGNAMLTLGSERHQKFYDMVKKREIFGCFCLTEIAHGSNTQAMGTKATYDPKNQEFIIHTPRLEDMKCWVGNLGHSATHAVVYAQLYTPDGVKHGLHAFVVPLRDPVTLLPYRGVMVGDMGPKIGFNSIENGFVYFDHVRIPRENLLNRSADVTPDGKYVTSAKSSAERQGLALGALSSARVGIVVFGPAALSMAVTIALRYSAVRRQFSITEGGPEVPVIEHPLQRWRIFPYLAATYLLQHLSYSLFGNLVVFHTGILMGDKSEVQNQTGKELHATSCAAKAISGFIMRDGLQECREACGGHGYMWASQIGRLRADFDPVLTYEGDNNVILFQTANFLLQAWEEYKSTGKIKSPLKSLEFLLDTTSKPTIKEAKDWLKPEVIITTYRWVVKFRLQRAAEALAKALSSGRSTQTARGELGPHHLRPLAISFSELFILERFYFEILQGEATSPKLKPVLERLFLLFGLWRLHQHSVLLLEGEFLKCSTNTIQEAQAWLCDALKPDYMALVDAMAVPDYVLASPIGASDGEAYKNLIQTFLREPGCFDRPPYWETMIPKTRKSDLNSGSAKI